MAKLNPATFHRSIHIYENKLNEQSQVCPFCLSTDRNDVGILQEDPRIFLLKCNFCSAVSASRIPTQEALTEYYNIHYEPAESDRITFNDTSRFGKHLALFFRRQNHKNEISILDFGGGNGAISYSVAEQLIKRGIGTVNIVVVDYGESIITTQYDNISIKKISDLDEINEYFDFIIASAVIEHIPEPNKIIDSLLSYLNKDGIFYVRTPYIVPLLKILSKINIGVDFTYPAHLHDLGQDFWEKYFNKEKYLNVFSIVKSNPSIVQTTFRDNFFKTLAAYIFKIPWFLFRHHYKLVGGWEVFVKKN